MKRQMKYERIFNTDGGCKKGNCNQGTRNCSQKERMTVEELMPLVAEGKVAICANKTISALTPRA